MSFLDYFGLSEATLLLALFYLLAFRNVMRILRQDLNEAAALGWIAVNLTFPFVGVPLFALLGQNKVDGYTHRRSRRQARYGEEGHNNQVIPLQEMAAMGSFSEPFHRILTAFDLSFRVWPGGCQLLINGENAFPIMFQAISDAKKYIFVQYYILRQDRLGLELKKLLCRRAEAGVQIFVLIDDWGSWGLGRRYLAELRKSGVKLARFLPFQFRFGFQINFRNHRKLVLIDGKVAFTGGLNMGVEYVGRSREGYWRDTHCRLTGPCLKPLIDGFCQDWFFATENDLRTRLVLESTDALPVPFGEPILPIQVVCFGPGDDQPIGLTVFYQAISRAKSSLMIATPYFVPDRILAWALKMAALRGVQIKLLLPKRGDNTFVQIVSLVHAWRLSREVSLHVYTKGFMHQKVMVVDDDLTILGTSNLDNRSLFLNFETSVIVHDRALSHEVREMLDQDFKDSLLVRDSRRLIPKFARPFVGLIRLLGPLF